MSFCYSCFYNTCWFGWSNDLVAYLPTCLVCFHVLVIITSMVVLYANVVLDLHVSCYQLGYLMVTSCILLVAYFGSSCDDHTCLASYLVYLTVAFVLCLSLDIKSCSWSFMGYYIPCVIVVLVLLIYTWLVSC